MLQMKVEINKTPNKCNLQALGLRIPLDMNTLIDKHIYVKNIGSRTINIW